MSKKAVVELYFDVISAYSWISFESFLQYERVLPITLKLRPIAIGFILRDAANKPPAQVPLKAQNMCREVPLLANYWGFEAKPPSNFEETIVKRGSLQAQRFLTSIQLNKPEYLQPAARELWSRVWLRDEPIHELRCMREVCQKLNIPDAEAIIEEASSSTVKEALKRNTEEARASGAFGAPWIILKRDGQADMSLFGSDRLPLVCHLLQCEFKGPLKTNTNS